MKTQRTGLPVFFVYPPVHAGDESGLLLNDFFKRGIGLDVVTEAEDLRDKWRDASAVVIDGRLLSEVPRKLKRRENVFVLDDHLGIDPEVTASISRVGGERRTYSTAKEEVLSLVAAAQGRQRQAFVVGVSGTTPGLGSSTMAYYLAYQFQKRGHRSLAVDGFHYSGMKNVLGLSQPFADSLWTLEEAEAAPYLVGVKPSGSPARTQLINRGRPGQDPTTALMNLMMQTEKLRYDVIVVDLPIDPTDDPIALSLYAQLDVVVGVVGPGKIQQVHAAPKITNLPTQCPKATVVSFMEPYSVEPGLLTALRLNDKPTELSHVTGAKWQRELITRVETSIKATTGLENVGSLPFSQQFLQRDPEREGTDQRLRQDVRSEGHYLEYVSGIATTLVSKFRPELRPPPTRWDKRAEAAQANPMISRRALDPEFARSLTD